ncbi:hypothetical protein AB0J21_10410 [Streptomyces sp. NPDC049954]|uniref:hypothetical protein n=1 Tax=Streptomyces sp. NPDC049954 TaxID=3155779 RepID=UPI003413DE60
MKRSPWLRPLRATGGREPGGGSGGGRGAPAAPSGQPNATSDPAAVRRREVVLVFGVRMRGTWPPRGYEPGPLPLLWRRPQNPVWSTTASRIKYTHAGLAPLLWDESVRWHRTITHQDGEPPERLRPAPSGLLLDAIELVSLNAHARSSLRAMRARPPANAVAVFHGNMPAHAAPADMIRLLRDCVDLDPEHADGAHRRWADEMLPPGWGVARDVREAVYLCLVTSTTGLPPLNAASARRGLDVVDQWLLHLYEASEKPGDRDIASRRISLAGGLRAVLGRRGLVAVGTENDVPRSGHEESYYEASSFFQRTLYTDALVMAQLQDILLDALDGEVELAARTEPDLRRIFRLERDLLIFRRSYLGVRFGPGDKSGVILRAWQTRSDTQAKVQSLKEDLAELSRQVQTSETETTNAILGLIAAIGLPLATGLAIWAGLPDAGATSLWWTLLPVLVTVLVLIAAVPGLRRLTLDAFKRRRRQD